jgi:hypothetical protein
MKLHTLEEIVEDITSFEGVKCKMSPTFKDVRFLKPYSEFYKRPTSSKVTVERLSKRIMEFLYADNIMLPPCNVFPNTNNRFWLYKAKVSENRALLLDKEMTLMYSTDFKEEAMEVASTGVFGTEPICLVSTDAASIEYFEAKLH